MMTMRFILLTILLAGFGQAMASSLTATPDTLNNLLQQAEPGSVIQLEPGTYSGPLVIDRTLTVRGQPGVVIDGRREGVVLSVNAPDVVVDGLELINDRGDIGELDAVILLAGMPVVPVF